MGGLAGLGVLRRRILRIQSKNSVLRRRLSSHVSSLMTFDKMNFSNPSVSSVMDETFSFFGSVDPQHSPPRGSDEPLSHRRNDEI